MTSVDIDIIRETHLSGEQQVEYERSIKMCLATLRIAFPVQARNYSEDEYQLLYDLWRHVFTGVDPEILQKAVVKFITNDRKGFYPAPGQVMEYVEKIVSEHKPNKWDKDIRQSYERLKALNEKLRNEENGKSCQYSEDVEEGLYCNDSDSAFSVDDGDLPDMPEDELWDFDEPYDYDGDDYTADT